MSKTDDTTHRSAGTLRTDPSPWPPSSGSLASATSRLRRRTTGPSLRQSSGDARLSECCTRVRRVGAREAVFYKGDSATHVYVVINGRVKVSAPSADGKEITFAILGPGELFGELGAIEESHHSATVTALEPSELGVFSHRDFHHLLASHPPFALRLLAVLRERLRKTGEMAQDIIFLNLPARLAKKLVELADAYGEPTGQGVRIGLHLCQQELANLVGSSRESVNKQLGLWQDRGLVRQAQGVLIVMRRPKLESLAGLTRLR